MASEKFYTSAFCSGVIPKIHNRWQQRRVFHCPLHLKMRIQTPVLNSLWNISCFRPFTYLILPVAQDPYNNNFSISTTYLSPRLLKSMWHSCVPTSSPITPLTHLAICGPSTQVILKGGSSNLLTLHVMQTYDSRSHGNYWVTGLCQVGAQLAADHWAPIRTQKP